MATKSSSAAAAGGKRKAFGKHNDDGRTKAAKTSSGKKHIKPEVEDNESSDEGSDLEFHTGENTESTPNESGNDSNQAKSGTSSREAHAKQKQIALERRNAKPLADEVHRTKKLWEKLRRKSHVPKEERTQLVEELFTIITGRVKDFVLKHDAVRAVQTAVKYATPAQRRQIAKELQGTYAQLAESRYAKFLIGKLLVQNDKEIRDLIVPEFYGKVRKLINHAEGSWILDDVYRGVATKEQKANLLREWYGPEYSLFRQPKGTEVTGDLSKILADDPAKRITAMKYLFDMANGLIQKKMTGFTMLHDALLQYFLNLKPETDEFKEFFETIKEDEGGDLLKNMAFTKSGARLVCLLLAHGTAKDRKQLLKAYKDTYQLMSGDTNAHTIILAAYDLLDDTVLTSKTIFSEILGKNDENEHIAFLANDLNARTTVLYLLEGMSKAVFPASHATDLEILKEIHEIRTKTSKKDPEVRRKELVTAISPQLLSAVTSHAADLVATSFGCQFVTDVLLSAKGDKEAALEAIASTAGGDPNAEAPEDAYQALPPHISTTIAGGRMFKTLIAGGRFDKASGSIQKCDPPLNFADLLYPVIKEHIVQWATGPSSWTVLAMLEASDFSSKKELLKTLKSNKKELTKAATEAPAPKKEETEEKPKAKKGKNASAPKGNQGSKLLLEKLEA
ncbi:armadillo-type protein [Pseudoneurospora amorphoporcata]|uniref:Armadillo-type protein n=1 Tax=Pseudoneurospora amorphoporcata TaxID=241081 RepID=A0AAN6P271_9PEZI|nr:armadillo-type protein [Pseudoneurospora amorphoporcata]